MTTTHRTHDDALGDRPPDTEPHRQKKEEAYDVIVDGVAYN
jgi:hypothetical protein